MAAYFPHGQKPFREIKQKFAADAAGVTINAADGFAFVTNQELTLSQRRELENSTSVDVQIHHLERITAALDKPAMREIRRQYLYIDYSDAPSRAELIDAARRAADQRRRQRLRAAGVPTERIASVVEWMGTDTPESPALDVIPGQLSLLAAPMGAGKTELAHDWFGSCLRLAERSEDSPFPVWLRARTVTSDVQDKVVESIGWSAIRSCGCAVVLDGVDEMAPAEGARIMESAEEFCTAWTETTILATGKPDQFLRDYRSLGLSAWQTERGHRLAEIVAGKRLPYALWSAELADALTSPLLAITIGARVAADVDIPKSRSALLFDIAEQSLRSARFRPSTAANNALAKIATYVVETGQAFPAGSLDPDVRNELAATPIVIDDDDLLTFALPVLEQTYAARAISLGLVSLGTVASPQQFPRWRFALTRVVDIDDDRQADEVLAQVAVTNAAAASWILDELTQGGGPSREGSSRTAAGIPLVQPVRLRQELVVDESRGEMTDETQQIAVPLRDAYRTWIDGLGSVGQDVSRSKDVAPSAWDVSANRDGLVLAWRSKSDGFDLGALPPGVHPFAVPPAAGRPAWSSIRSGSVPSGRHARWIWTRGFLREELEKRLRQFDLRCDPQGLLAGEKRWRLAQLVFHGDTRLGHPPIPLTPLREKAEDQLERTRDSVRATFRMGSSSYEKEDLVWLLDHLPEGNEALVRPVVTPDRTGGRWVWSDYSASQLHRLLIQVLEGALAGYDDLVVRNFSTFGRALGVASLAPVRIVGELTAPPDDQAASEQDDVGPTFRYSLLHNDDPANRPPIDIMLTHERTPLRLDFLGVDRNSRAAGPFARHELRDTQLSLEGPRPASEWAYQWLIDDLAAVGWVRSRWRTSF